MTYPTREQIEEYIRNNKLDADESYPRSDWWKFKQQRDAYKQQRNELIEDMAKLRERNAELERKAQAFDLISNSYTTEIEQAIRNKELDQCLFLLEQILDDLERGSDEEI